MSNPRKITDTNLSQEETDRILGRVIEAKFDAELKKDWEQKLQMEFGISKTPRKEGRVRSLGRRNWLYLAAIAASILLIIVALNLFVTPSPENPQSLAMSYIENTDIHHPGATKGLETETETTRQSAIEAFNAGQYPAAAQLFSAIAEKTEQDRYHSALASLLSQNYDESIAQFRQLSTASSTYQEEINWFLPIALLLDNQKVEAQEMLAAIQAGEWNFENAQKLLKSMK